MAHTHSGSVTSTRDPQVLDATTHPRDRAFCAIGLYTFQRGGEIAALKIADVDLKGFGLSMYRQKTKQYDILPISAELAEELVAWFNYYAAEQGALHEDWYLVPALHRGGTRTFLPGSNVLIEGPPRKLNPTKKMGDPYGAPQRALRNLGYDTHREGEHTLRRSGARALFDSLRESGHGSDSALMRVASMLGHADIKTTQHYIGWEPEREARNKAFAGQVMFPEAKRTTGTLRVIGGNDG